MKNSWLPGFIGFIGILLVLFAIIGFYAASKLKSGVLFCNGCCLAVIAVLMLGFGIFCLADRCVLDPHVSSVECATPCTPVSRSERERGRGCVCVCVRVCVCCGVRRVADGWRGACECSKDAQKLVKQELPLIVERFVNVCPHCCLNASKTVTEDNCPVSA